MRIAIPNGSQYDGVTLLTKIKVPPFPANAIPFRVDSNSNLDFDILKSVPEMYRILDVDSQTGHTVVREMTIEEKKIVDNNNLENIKEYRIQKISEANHNFEDQGFSHPLKPNVIFNNDTESKVVKFALYTMSLSSDVTGQFMQTKNIDGEKKAVYTFESSSDVQMVFAKGSAFFARIVYEGQKIIEAIKLSSDIDSLRSIVDQRTWSEMDTKANDLNTNPSD